MSWLCRLGIHRWEFKDVRGSDGEFITLACCKRGCRRYAEWCIVNITRTPW